jgi:phage tail-like protein
MVETGAQQAVQAVAFSLTVDGVEIARFSGLGGISSEIDVVEYLEGDKTRSMMPGRRRPPIVMLKRGMGGDTSIAAWHESVASGDVGARKNCSLKMLDAEGRVRATYALDSAWPSKLEVASIGGTSAFYETVTLVCGEIRRLPTK